jgi:hypothetical protein
MSFPGKRGEINNYDFNKVCSYVNGSKNEGQENIFPRGKLKMVIERKIGVADGYYPDACRKPFKV